MILLIFVHILSAETGAEPKAEKIKAVYDIADIRSYILSAETGAEPNAEKIKTMFSRRQLRIFRSPAASLHSGNGSVEPRSFIIFYFIFFRKLS
jgi:hypothetical protein